MVISVILPAYKESENLKNILPKLNLSLESLQVSYEVLVVDTIEPLDDTKEICEENHCVYIQREGGNFYGDAIRTGVKYSRGDFVVIMDADGSHDPSDVARLFGEMKTGKYDLIIGSRYCRGGKTDNGLILRLMSYAVNLSYRIMFGIKARDISNSFRLYKGNQIRAIKTECKNFDIIQEILIMLIYSHENFSISEMPIHFNKRARGESKRDLKRFVLSYLRTMKRLMKIKAEHKRTAKIL